MHGNHTGLFVKGKMIERGLTQIKLARDIGVSHTRLSQWMNGHDIPSDRVIRKVAVKLDLDFEELRLKVEKERYQRERDQLHRKYAEILPADSE